MIALPPLAQGTTFAGEYRILELLSQTNQLALYGVAHVPTGELRVLELLFSPVVPGAAFRDRFVRAALDSARAASPIVPRVLAAGIDTAAQIPFVATEAFRGEVLSAAALRGGGLPVNDAMTVLGQIATGLTQIHGAGLVHGGIRPEAVVLTADPTQRLGVKLLNASLTKVLGDARVAAAPSAVPCDPMWAAPEQIEGGEATVQSDVYSFALLAFNVLTGHRIWRGTTEAQVAREATKEAMPIPTNRAYELGRGGTLPNTFDAWFARCGARSKHERFPTVDVAFLELQSAFQRAAAHYTGSLQPMTSAHLSIPPAPKKSGGAGVLVAVGALGGLLAIGVMGTLAYHGVAKYRQRAQEAKIALEQSAQESAKAASAELTQGSQPNAAPAGEANADNDDVPSVDINALPTKGSRRDRRASAAERAPDAVANANVNAKKDDAPAAKANTTEPAAAANGAPASPASLAESAPVSAKLQVIDLSSGRGKAARAGDKITVRYTGKRQADGVVYDGSHSTSPYSFQLGTGKVTKGWEQGIPGMKVGGKRRLVVPPQLAYGEKGLGAAVPPNATLVFDIELVSVD